MGPQTGLWLARANVLGFGEGTPPSLLDDLPGDLLPPVQALVTS